MDWILIIEAIRSSSGISCDEVLSPGGPGRPTPSAVSGWRLSQAAALGHPAQSQHVKADVAHSHRLVQVKLDDGDLLYRALVAQQAPAVAARVGHQRHKR